MYCRNRFIFILVLTFGLVSLVFSQFGFLSRSQDPEQLYTHVIIFSAESPDTSQILIFIKLENSALQFVKTGNHYQAGYELTISVENEQDILFSQIRRGSLLASTFDETQSQTLFKYEFFRAFLIPGQYQLRIQLYDLETRKPVTKKEELHIPDYREQPLVISDILFLNEFHLMPLENLKPVMPPIRAPSDTAFGARIDLYSSESQVTLFETIRNQFKILYNDTVLIDLPQKRRTIYFELNQNLPFGEYILAIRAKNRQSEETVEASFYVQSRHHPATIPDLETAIASLTYIVEQKQWNQLQSASATEQERLLKEFWKSRDPDTGTEGNVLEEEYYRRVVYANREFSVFKNSRQGWRTDRGRIYILYGPPTDIDRPAMRSATEGRFEIWVYHHLQQRFVFYDKYADGDYRLISQE